MWAGRAVMTGALWSGTRVKAGEASDAARWGIPAELMADPEDEDTVWPEHVPAVEAFLVVCSQWRLVQRVDEQGRLRSQVLGLDYAAAEAGLRLAGIHPSPALWADLRAVEQGAKAALNES